MDEEELEARILDSFRDEAEKWVMEPVSSFQAAGRIIFWVAILKALGAGESLSTWITIGERTSVVLGSGSETVH